MTGRLSLFSEQTGLRGGTAEGSSRGRLVRAFLVETETLGMDLEETFGCFPVLTFAAHALAEDARIEFAVACFADSIQHTVGFRRQLLTQTLFEVWRNVAGQTQHVDERILRARFFRALQQHRNIGRETRNNRRDADAHSDSRGGERFHRMKSRFRKWRV